MTSANGVMTANGGASASKDDKKILLLQSICKYLKVNGLTKTVKKLKSEAKLDEDEVLATSVLDLEEVYSKYLEARTSAVKTPGESDKGVKSNGNTKSMKVEDSEIETVSKKKKKQKPVEDVTAKDSKNTKDSKKRKQYSAEDDDAQVTGPSADDVATPRKTAEGQGEDSVAKKTEYKHGAVEQTYDATNGNCGDKSTSQKSAKRQKNGSAEPTTVKAFQRVKVDEVVITDERLKDNSYWAKDGAESGYGAKAQEVLGQVRGKDFRHEKTKKKRGSYRGGNIDLQSHSVKFNDSDDE